MGVIEQLSGKSFILADTFDLWIHTTKPDLERMLPPPPPNYAHVVVGGHLILMNRANFQMAEIFHFEIH